VKKEKREEMKDGSLTVSSFNLLLLCPHQCRYIVSVVTLSKEQLERSEMRGDGIERGLKKASSIVLRLWVKSGKISFPLDFHPLPLIFESSPELCVCRQSFSY
jgi:hypothetical protein